MPKTNRPADVVGNAVAVMREATGEAEAAPPKNEEAAALGRLGAAARTRNLTPERRSEIARLAAQKRWGR